MCVKDWSARYEDLLINFNIPSLKQRRKILKLCFLYQVKNGFFFFPNAPVYDSPMDSRLRNFNPSRLSGPSSRTLAYDRSFSRTLLNSGTNCLLKFQLLHPSLNLRELFEATYLILFNLIKLLVFVSFLFWLVPSVLAFATGTTLHLQNSLKKTKKTVLML